MIPKSLEELKSSITIVGNNNYMGGQLQVDCELTEMKNIMESTVV